MRIRRIVRVCLGFFLLLSAAPGARAFDYDEHKYLSNVAFRLALASFLDPCMPEDELRRLVSRTAIDGGYSFGDIVALGDYVHDVEAFLERDGELNPRQDSYRSFAWEHIPELKNDRLRFLQAAHVNESHFQQGALMAHLNHHDSAILMARSGRIFRALVLEAYGLHFLEDFHAPGHVATARAFLPDYVAIAMHEKFNSEGIDFRVRDDRDRDLSDLIAKAATLDFEALAHEKMPRGLILTREDFEALKATLDGPPQRFRGDSLLRVNKVQAAYLAVLAARSVLDVLNAARIRGGGDAPSTTRNSFVPVCWYFGFCPENVACEDGQVSYYGGPLKRAATPFGEYDGSHLGVLPSLVPVFGPGDVLMLSYYNEFSTSSGIEGRAGNSELVVESLLVSTMPLKFVKVGKAACIPSMIRLNPVTKWFATSLLYGASWTEGDLDSRGLHARLLLAIPRIDVQASLSYGVRYYELGGGHTTVAYPIGYGVEAGFGFFLLHLGINEELSRVPLTGKLKSRRLVRTGLTFILPKSVYRAPFRWVGRKLKGAGERED